MKSINLPGVHQRLEGMVLAAPRKGGRKEDPNFRRPQGEGLWNSTMSAPGSTGSQQEHYNDYYLTELVEFFGSLSAPYWMLKDSSHPIHEKKTVGQNSTFPMRRVMIYAIYDW